MDDTKQTMDELMDGPVSPKTELSHSLKRTEPKHPTNEDVPGFSEVTPYGRGTNNPKVN